MAVARASYIFNLFSQVQAGEARFEGDPGAFLQRDRECLVQVRVSLEWPVAAHPTVGPQDPPGIFVGPNLTPWPHNKGA